MAYEPIHNEPILLQQASAGDQLAFRQLFDGYWDHIYHNALKLLKSPEPARELAQEVFIRIWLKRDKLAAVQQFRPWLFRVAKNIFLDHLRSRLVTTVLQDLHQLELQEEAPTAQKQLELRELQSLINDAITQLPAQMQMAFTLSRFQGLTHEQIARKMNISKATSQNYIARSLVIIRKQLLQYLGLF